MLVFSLIERVSFFGCIFHTDYILMLLYTDHAGLEISVNSRIASRISRQIAIGNAGPATALESMGGKRFFRCHFLNIGLMYK